MRSRVSEYDFRSPSGSVGHVQPLQRQFCGWCAAPLTGKQQSFCSDSHRWKAWDQQNPRQARLDFTPAASQLAHSIRGRESKAQRILARLRQGPAGTMELAQIGGIRFGARLNELKARGLRWDREDHKDGVWEYSTYTMTHDVEAE
jgi:hypothetical protein